ncbi:MAG: molybdopterin-dependent oxidoreductase, partial [Deltaproteobacteria bacterium]|nr:molybdopterin-dependent oxidoreductase [Deltaproteobacteria bacterium]
MRKSQAFNIVGGAHLRVDGEEKVTGKAVYTGDVEIAGMTYGKILRSPFPHAKLVKIDTHKAERLSGVITVLTRQDLSDFSLYYGAAYKDQGILAVDKVRYAGDPVAAVVAVDEVTAEEALTLIEADYEELPVVTTIEEALMPNAPLVHGASPTQGELHGYHYQAPEKFAGTNICYHFSFAKGDIAEGFKKAHHIFEDTFTFPRVQHYSMEPHITIAHVEGDRITLWASTQDPFTLR